MRTGSLADDHRFAADLDLFENSSIAGERNVNTTWAAHADAREAGANGLGILLAGPAADKAPGAGYTQHLPTLLNRC